MISDSNFEPMSTIQLEELLNSFGLSNMSLRETPGGRVFVLAFPHSVNDLKVCVCVFIILELLLSSQYKYKMDELVYI